MLLIPVLMETIAFKQSNEKIFLFATSLNYQSYDGHEPSGHSHIRHSHLPCGINEPVQFLWTPASLCTTGQVSSLCPNLYSQPHLVCSFGIRCIVCYKHRAIGNHQVSLHTDHFNNRVWTKNQVLHTWETRCVNLLRPQEWRVVQVWPPDVFHLYGFKNIMR